MTAADRAGGGPTSGGPTSGGPTSGGPTSGGPTSGRPPGGRPPGDGPVGVALPGSAGEHRLQEQHGTSTRAKSFYDHQVLDHLNTHMRAFVARMEMVFVATSDAHGETDCSFRAGPPGFVAVLDHRTLAYPEYRGNGVMASLGNLTENGHVGLLFLDLCGDAIGLHVNGRASVVENDALAARRLPRSARAALEETGGRHPERWVVVDVVEAYIHCSKHIPQLVKRSEAVRDWGTDDVAKKGGDYFRISKTRRHAAVATAALQAAPAVPVQEPVTREAPVETG